MTAGSDSRADGADGTAGDERSAADTSTLHVHTSDRCCRRHGHHVMPHRGCFLR